MAKEKQIQQESTDEELIRQKKRMPRWLGITLRVVIITFVSVILIAAGYLLYVVISYSRIPDNQVLDVNQRASYEETGNVNLYTEYTIVTQNIGFGAYTQDFTFFMDGGKESWAKSKESVIDCINQGMQKITSFNPDFVVIQEIDFDSTRSYHTDQRDIINPYFENYSYDFAVNYHSAFLMYPFSQPHGASKSGIETLSRFPIESAIRRSLPISTSFSKFLDLDRCYSKTKIPTSNGKYLVIYNAHLSAYGNDDAIREGQMRMLFGDMQEEYDAGNYCICGGDFNHDFTGDSVEKINGRNDVSSLGWAQPFPYAILAEYMGIKRCIEYNNDELLPTCRNCDIPYKVGNFTIIVDGFLVSANVQVNSLENVQTDFVYSDHNPVVMKFILM